MIRTEAEQWRMDFAGDLYDLIRDQIAEEIRYTDAEKQQLAELNGITVAEVDDGRFGPYRMCEFDRLHPEAKTMWMEWVRENGNSFVNCAKHVHRLSHQVMDAAASN